MGRFAAKVLIFCTYLFPLVFISEIVLRGVAQLSVVFAVLVVLLMFVIRDKFGGKLFTVQRLSRYGPLYFYRLRLADLAA